MMREEQACKMKPAWEGRVRESKYTWTSLQEAMGRTGVLGLAPVRCWPVWVDRYPSRLTLWIQSSIPFFLIYPKGQMYFGVLNFYNHLVIFSSDSVRLPYILSGVVWMFLPQGDILYILLPRRARVTHASLLCFLTSLSSALCVLNFKGAENPISALWLYMALFTWHESWW